MSFERLSRRIRELMDTAAHVTVAARNARFALRERASLPFSEGPLSALLGSGIPFTRRVIDFNDFFGSGPRLPFSESGQAPARSDLPMTRRTIHFNDFFGPGPRLPFSEGEQGEG